MTTGIIKKFNGQFGFIKSSSGETFFHKNDIVSTESMCKNDEVEFLIKPSKRKQGQFQAHQVRLVKKAEIKVGEPTSLKIGKIDWFDLKKGFGVILTPDIKNYFLHISNFNSDYEYLQPDNVLIFQEKSSKGKLQASNCYYASEKLLATFFEHHSEFVSTYPEFCYPLWLEGLTKKRNLSYISERLGKDSIGYRSNPFSQIFQKLDKPEEQKIVLNQFLSSLPEFISDEKYVRIKTIASSSEINESIRVTFLQAVYDKATLEIKFKMWHDELVDEKNLNDIVERIKTERFNGSMNPVKSIFQRLKKSDEQRSVLIKYAQSECIDTNEKYGRLKAIGELEEINKDAKKEFLDIVYEKASKEVKYKLWIDDLTDIKDLEIIAERLKTDSSHRYSNNFKSIFQRLEKSDEQKSVLSEYAQSMITDSDDKYERLKAITKLDEIDENAKYEFLKIARQNATKEFKFKMWLDQTVEDIDFNYVIFKFKNTNTSKSSDYKRIINRLNEQDHLNPVLEGLCTALSPIDTLDKYTKLYTILSLENVDSEIKANLIKLLDEFSSEAFRYQLWIEDYIENIESSIILRQIVQLEPTSYSNPYVDLIQKVGVNTFKKEILPEFISYLTPIDRIEKYDKLKALLSIEGMLYITEEIYSSLSESLKLQFWIDGFYHSYNKSHLIDGIASMSISLSILKLVFNKITDFEVKKLVIDGSINKLQRVQQNKEYQYYREIFRICEDNTDVFESSKKRLFSISSVLNKLRLAKDYPNNFNYSIIDASTEIIELNEKLIDIIEVLGFILDHELSLDEFLTKTSKALNPSEILHVINHFSEPLLLKPSKNKYSDTPLIKLLQRDIPYIENNLKLFPSKFISEIRSFYRKHYYYRYSQYLVSDKLNIRLELLKSLIRTLLKNIDSIFSPDNILDDKDLLVSLKGLSSLTELASRLNEEELFSEVKDAICQICDNRRDAIYKGYQHLNKDNEIFEFLISLNHSNPDFLNELLIDNKKPISYSIKLKLWLYDVIDDFDFNNYCFYYFSLSPVERSRFNKKATAQMGEEIRSSMLKKREPWRLISKDELSGQRTFEATWKSIWFGEGHISFCMDKDSNFSPPVVWDFSEDKFNLLYDYITGKKLNKLIVSVQKGVIVDVSGLEELEEVIWKVLITRELEDIGNTGSRGSGENRIPINMVLRNQCIQFLNKLQVNDFVPTRILEKSFNLNRDSFNVDISLLYSIPIENEEIAIIWESLELEKSKATHIFKCKESEYNTIFSEIEVYLSSNTKVRSSLQSTEKHNVKKQIELKYLCRIDHDNFSFSKWENSLYRVFPELSYRLKEHY
jgi:cold shock CspA family protein